MSSDIKLSRKQEEIVNIGEGPICVKACAGSGKTRVLTERIRRILLQDNTKKRILALTFTNKAAQEMKDRLKDISDLDNRAFIGTFHGFCQRILENHGYLIGLNKMPHIFENKEDLLELMKQAISLTPSYIKYNGQFNEEANHALDIISKAKRELNDKDLSNDKEDLALLCSNYQDLLRSQNAIDFDDLLSLAYRLLTDFPDIASLYRRSFCTICIDEAQDLNKVQYHFLLSLTGNEFKNLMIVGDPNQSIFQFAGASTKYMKCFVKHFTAQVIELKENYRSSQKVLDATKKIFNNSLGRQNVVKKGIFEIKCFNNDDAEAHWIVDKIQELLSMKNHEDIEGDIIYEKIAILARNRYILSSAENELNKKGIPFYYKIPLGPIGFESELMKIFFLALKIHINPLDRLHKEQLIKQIGSNRLNIEMEWNEFIKNIDDFQKSEVLMLVSDLRDDGSNLNSLLEKIKNIEIRDDNEKNMFFNDISLLNDHWNNYAKRTDNKSIHRFKNSMALGQTYPLTENKGVTLSTVHTMKGQEFDIIFLMGMDNGTFPDYRAIKKGGVEMTQEKNNLYVAFTRSRRFLYVTWPRNRKMKWGVEKPRSISRFLKPVSSGAPRGAHISVV